MAKSNVCANCEYVDTALSRMRCRRNPPQIGVNGIRGFWPEVEPHDTCAEFKGGAVKTNRGDNRGVKGKGVK